MRTVAHNIDVEAPKQSASNNRPSRREPASPLNHILEVIKQERTAVMEVAALLHNLHDVLLYADDDHSIMHADQAKVGFKLLSELSERLEVLANRCAVRRSK